MVGWNGSGGFDIPYPDFVNGTTMNADEVDANFLAVKQALENCLTRDGQGKPTADLDWNTKRIKNAADGVDKGDYITVQQFQSQGKIYFPGLAQSTNVYRSTGVGLIPQTVGGNTPFVGSRLSIRFDQSNTGAVTFQVDSLLAFPIKKRVGPDLVNLEKNDLVEKSIYQILFSQDASSNYYWELSAHHNTSGTWMPTLYGGTTAGSTNYTGGAQLGLFHRTGNYVELEGLLTWTGVTGTGQARIGGLPFTPRAGYNGLGRFVPYFWEDGTMSLPANNVLGGFVDPTDPSIRLFNLNYNGVRSDCTLGTHFDAGRDGGSLRFTAGYFI